MLEILEEEGRLTLSKKDIPPAADVERFGLLSVFKLVGILFVAGLLLVLLIPWFIFTKIRKFAIPNTSTARKKSSIESKYDATSSVYDVADWYWERIYQTMRHSILSGADGKVLEVGVGTGNNLRFYDAENLGSLTAVDISEGMLEKAKKKKAQLTPHLDVSFVHASAANLEGIASSSFDWYISTFLFCVLPDELQTSSIDEMARVLRRGGRFRIVEMVRSRYWVHRIPQVLFHPWIKALYGASFDRKTFELLQERTDLKITRAVYLKADTYLLIEGVKL